MAGGVVTYAINLGGNAFSGFDKLFSGFKKVNSAAEETESLLARIGKASIAINNIGQIFQTIAGKVSGGIGRIIDAGSENELQRLDMTTLFKGNAEAADEMFRKISEYGKATVYDKTGLIEAQKTMMSFGLSGEKSFNTLKQIGDIAMGDSQKMQSLALAFSQVTSAGKLQGQDLMQLINAGFNPLQVISEHTGKSMSQLKDEMSKGQISAEMLAQAFTWATEEGGLFYQGAEKAGNSTAGRINQLKDTFDEFLIGVFDKLKPVIDTCIDFATNILSFLPGLFDGIGNAVSGVIDFFSEYRPIILGVAGAIAILTVAMNTAKISMLAQEVMLNILMIKEAIVAGATKIWAGAQALLNAVMAANPIVLIVAGIMILVGAIVWVCSKITGWGSLWKGVVGFMKYSFYAFIDGIKLYFTTWAEGFMIGLDKIRLGWYKFKEALGIGDSAENQTAIAEINEDVERRKQAIRDAADKVAENAAKAKESLQGIEMGWKKSEKSTSDGGLKDKLGINGQLEASVNGGLGGGDGKDGGGDTETDATTNAIATGGTRNTTVNINLGKMVESINFNGSVGENAGDIERKFEELFLRVLYMAQNA